MKDKIKICFLGNSPISVYALKAIYENDNFEISLIISNKDKLIGKTKQPQSNPVVTFAKNHNLDILQTNKVNNDYKYLKDNYQFDYLVTCSFGQILSIEILSLGKKYPINVHASLLPKGRGGAPIHGAILHNQKETGISIMEMNEKMDQGDFFIQHSLVISSEDTYDSLHDKIAHLIYQTFANDLLAIDQGRLEKQAQDQKLVSYWLNIKPEDEKLNFDNKIEDIHQKIKALNSRPGAYALINNQRIKIFKSKIIKQKHNYEKGTIIKVDKEGILVAAKNGIMLLDDIIIPGKKRNFLSALSNGKLPFQEGEKFS